MKNLIFRISLFAFVFVLVSFAPPAKVKYSTSEGKLSITFPTDYESVNKDSEDYTSVHTQASLEDQLYFVSYNVHKLEITEHESLADTSLDSFNEVLGGTITKRAPWDVKKHKGLQAYIEVPADNLKIEYRVVLIGQIQYQVVVISESSKWNQEKAANFFKSFKVKK